MFIFCVQYKKWENFSKVIDRAKIACQNSGRNIEDDFPEVRKIVKAGATEKPVLDYELTRYACYLIVLNCDPRKKIIALAKHSETIEDMIVYQSVEHGDTWVRPKNMWNEVVDKNGKMKKTSLLRYLWKIEIL